MYTEPITLTHDLLNIMQRRDSIYLSLDFTIVECFLVRTERLSISRICLMTIIYAYC